MVQAADSPLLIPNPLRNLLFGPLPLYFFRSIFWNQRFSVIRSAKSLDLKHLHVKSLKQRTYPVRLLSFSLCTVLIVLNNRGNSAQTHLYLAFSQYIFARTKLQRL